MPNFPYQETVLTVYPSDKVYTPETNPATLESFMVHATSIKTTFEAVELQAAHKL